MGGDERPAHEWTSSRRAHRLMIEHRHTAAAPAPGMVQRPPGRPPGPVGSHPRRLGRPPRHRRASGHRRHAVTGGEGRHRRRASGARRRGTAGAGLLRLVVLRRPRRTLGLSEPHPRGQGSRLRTPVISHPRGTSPSRLGAHCQPWTEYVQTLRPPSTRRSPASARSPRPCSRRHWRTVGPARTESSSPGSCGTTSARPAAAGAAHSGSVPGRTTMRLASDPKESLSSTPCSTAPPWQPASGYCRAMLEEGTRAPEFILPDQHGVQVSLADQRGHWVLLWWYPKASTPG